MCGLEQIQDVVKGGVCRGGGYRRGHQAPSAEGLIQMCGTARKVCVPRIDAKIC